MIASLDRCAVLWELLSSYCEAIKGLKTVPGAVDDELGSGEERPARGQRRFLDDWRNFERDSTFLAGVSVQAGTVLRQQVARR